jgi:hypothetical protein
MKLITETMEDIDEIEILNEVTGLKERFISGIFMQGDVKNKNGRVYPLSVLTQEVSRYNTEMIQQNRALGELSHPTGPQINLDRVSHQIVELKQSGKNFVGKAKVLDTPTGKIVESFLKAGIKIGVSSRGMGSVVEKNGINEVQDDFRLATVDIVSDPSAPAAFVKGIMENVEWVFDNGIFKEKEIDNIKKVVRKTSRKNLEETYVNLFENFLSRY